MTLSELVRMFGDSAEIVVTIILAYAVYKLAELVGTLNRKIKEDSLP